MPELELKLSLALEDLPQALNAFADRPDGRLSRSTLVSTYYDTPDYALRKCNLVLRVRRDDSRFIQTVKTDALNGQSFLERGQCEDDLPGEQPDPAAANSSGVLPKQIKPHELRAIFVTSVRRSVLLLEPRPETCVEVAFDEGEIRAANEGATEPLSEIEFELKSGDPTALYDLASALLDAVPARVDLRSKAARGYRLVEAPGEAPSARRLDPVPLVAGLTVEETLQRVGHACLKVLLSNEAAALADVPEGIHQMRVASRRLRSLLSAMKRMLPEHQYRAVNEELRWLADALGPARNWDVISTSLIEPLTATAAPEVDFSPLSEAAGRARYAAYDKAKAAIQSPRYARAVLLLMRWLECREWRQQPIAERPARLVADIGAIASDLIDRQYRKARKRSKRIRQAGALQRHRLRIALKKLRYTTDFLKPLFNPGQVESFNARVKRLQNDLGDANDVRVAGDLFARLDHGGNRPDDTARGAGFVLGWHKKRLAHREASVQKHVRRFRRVAPFW